MAELDDGASPASVSRSIDPSGTPVIAIGGEVDVSNVVAIEAQLASAIDDAPPLLVLDLSELNFIDSSGIAVLLRAAERAGRLELRNPSGTVQRIIQATGLSEILHIEA